MKMIGKFIFSFFSNALAILIAAYFIADFIFDGTIVDLLWVSLLFALINTLLKPVLKFVFKPIIVLTLGLFVIVVNALTLFILDLLSASLTIQGYVGLVIATVIVGAVNGIVHLAGKWAYQTKN